MKNTILIITAVFLFGCSSNKVATTPKVDAEETAIESDKKLKADELTAELSLGKTHYEAHCAKCHSLQDPTSKTPEEWKKIVPSMAGYVNGETEVLDRKTQESILNYLIAMTNK